jgi:hypothetical protein
VAEVDNGMDVVATTRFGLWRANEEVCNIQSKRLHLAVTTGIDSVGIELVNGEHGYKCEDVKVSARKMNRRRDSIGIGEVRSIELES